jgi:predicted GNAT family N-acyltransferase
MNENIIFDSLLNHPEFIDELRQIYWSEWSESLKKEFNIENFSEYQITSNITLYIGREYLSENKKKLVGSVGLIDCDMQELKHLTPWMCNVYILPEYRNKRIAHKMINWFLNKEQQRPIYLWCNRPLENFYKNFNFEIFENKEDEDIVVMRN